MSRLVEVSDIAAMLADRVHALVGELFPAGVREGHEWRVGSLAGEPGRSLAVHLGGVRAGVWSDFSTGEAGDALDLVAHTLYGGDKGKAIRWARAWLGIDGVAASTGAAHRGTVGAPGAAASKRRRAAAADDTRMRNRAFSLWLGSQERLEGTPVARYLAGRGIDLAALGRAPRALRYHVQLWNREGNRGWPAMVAAISGPDGSTKAIHRTWLDVRSGGCVVKAPLKDPKMTLGRYRGGCIRLWRGASGKPLKAAPVGEAVILTEGIEDGLTAALACPEMRVLVAVSLANMAAVVLPDSVTKVVLCADNDGDNAQAQAGLTRAAEAFHGQGRKVSIARVPEHLGKDLNELLMRSRAR